MASSPDPLRRRLLQTGLATALLPAALPARPATAAPPAAPPAASLDGAAAGWSRWRGPTGDNHAAPGASVPDRIVPSAITWSVDLPGRGHSSPVVVGAGADQTIVLATADTTKQTQSVLAVTAAGRPKWGRVVHRGGLPAENHPKNTESSCTVASDGESVFASFYNDSAIRLTKLDLAGQVQWQQSVGRFAPNQYKYGYAASPLLIPESVAGQRLVVVVGDFDGDGFLAALDPDSGEPVWKVRRPTATSFSSPILARVAGRDQILLSGAEMVAAYNPSDGQLLWSVPGATTMATCGTMVWTDDLVFASGGYPKPQTVAIRADGSGEVVWDNTVKCYEQSMLRVGDHLYAVSDNGAIYCWRAADGKTMWRTRFAGPHSASPILVGDVIHAFNEQGLGRSFEANPDRYVQRSEHKIADEVFATPAVVGETMFLRVANRKGGRRQEQLLAIR